jgi:hypothetical protein
VKAGRQVILDVKIQFLAAAMTGSSAAADDDRRECGGRELAGPYIKDFLE